MKTPMTAVASSGAEEPAAMKVAPATSCDICNAAIMKSIPVNEPCCFNYSVIDDVTNWITTATFINIKNVKKRYVTQESNNTTKGKLIKCKELVEFSRISKGWSETSKNLKNVQRSYSKPKRYISKRAPKASKNFFLKIQEDSRISLRSGFFF